MSDENCSSCVEARKAWEIAWCWDNQPETFDWTSGYDRGSECEAMWAAHAGITYSGLRGHAHLGAVRCVARAVALEVNPNPGDKTP